MRNLIVGLILVCGCGSPSAVAPVTETQPIVESQPLVERQPTPEQPEEPLPGSSGSALSDDETKRLFESAWTAEYDWTQDFEPNQSVADLKGSVWLYCVQWKFEGHFVDAGFKAKSKMEVEPHVYDLDFDSPAISENLRVIDNDHFALRVNGPFWLVFEANDSTDAERLADAREYATRIMSEADPRLRSVIATISKHGESFETQTTWDDQPIVCRWALTTQPTKRTPCTLNITIPDSVTQTNYSGAVMKGWSSVNPQPIVGAELTIMRLVDGVAKNSEPLMSDSGWNYQIDRKELRTYEIRFWPN